MSTHEELSLTSTMSRPPTLEESRPFDPRPSAVRFPEPVYYSAMRQLFERAAAAIALLLLSPLLIVVGSVVRLTSLGPALYTQERVGRAGARFRIWKFRTMVDAADRQLEQLLDQHGRSSQPLFKVPHDPRITRVGRILRKSSLDELPQLVNVVRGEMSFIGPRPQRPPEVALYDQREMGRLAVLPGLTGLWQVNGRSDLSWRHSIELDLQYVHHRCLLLDVKILVKTITVVATGRGAT